MTTFAAIAALFLAAAVGLLARPLLRVGPEGGRPRAARATALAVALLLPAAVVLIYLEASNWDWDAPPPQPGLTALDQPTAAALDAVMTREMQARSIPGAAIACRAPISCPRRSGNSNARGQAARTMLESPYDAASKGHPEGGARAAP